MVYDSIAERVPMHIRPVSRPRMFGMIMLALEEGPGSAQSIIDRLRNKGYRYYPDKRRISAICSKFKNVFIQCGTHIAGNVTSGATHKVIVWKLRDDIHVVD
jgi:hypothetical protein